MTARIIELVIVILGLAFTWVLFYRLPILPGNKNRLAQRTDPSSSGFSLSVIIPARNEEQTLPMLLADLQRQTVAAAEIICVDDASDDATAQIARAYGARLISLHDKPAGWIGKSWACQNGADAATGDVLLFLDADVRLGQNALSRLIQTYEVAGCTISVQPFHRTKKAYEQFSLIFNLVQLAANGMALPKPLNVGLYGPVILITRADYLKAGGHEQAKSVVTEDIALGALMRKASVPFQLFIGDPELSFRMYGNGFRSLLQGWVKNQATGAAKTPFPLFLMVFFWITSMASVPLQLAKHSSSGLTFWLVLYILLYLIWVLRLHTLTRKVGYFQRWAVILFPIPVLVYLGVFVVSMVKKIFRLKVIWKGRAIDVEEKRCG